MARISGMVSGLDTDSLIQELVSAYETKKESYVKKQTKLEWTQTTWKDLNKKVYSFYTGALNTARFSSAYTAKKAVVSDTTKATVSASNSAVTGTQTLKITSLAKTAYLTGAVVESADADTKLTSKSKLSELAGFTDGGNGSIDITVDGKTTTVSVNGDTTINQFVTKLKEAGLDANYDENNQRFFISAKQSGAEHSFSVTAGNTAGMKALGAMGLSTASESDVNAYMSAAKAYGYDPANPATYNSAASDAIVQKNAENEYVAYVLEKRNTDLSTQVSNLTKEQTELKDKLDFANLSGEKQTEKLDSMQKSIDEIKKAFSDGKLTQNADGTYTYDSTGMSDEDKAKYDEKLQSLNDAQAKYDEYKSIQEQVYTISTDSDGNKTYTKVSDDDFTAVVNHYQNAINAKSAEIENLNKEITLNKELIAKAGQDDNFDFSVSHKSAVAYTQTITTKDSDGNETTTTRDVTYQELLDTVNQYAVEYGLAETKNSTTNGFLQGTGYDSELAASTDARDKTKELADAAYLYSTTDDEAVKEAQAAILNIKTGAKGAVKIEGQDATIELNGATFTSTTNDFSINGLVITATGLTEGDGISINTTSDIDGIYDSIKKFISGYNEILKEMNTLYYADSAKGYEPLTDDEKDAMTDTEIEKWETKIKESLLRRDDTLSSIMTAMQNDMARSITINGKSYSMSTFGISTGSYFSVSKEERGVYHIDGNPDDSTTSGNEDKLKAALASDPDAVINFFTDMSNQLYNTLTKKMKSTSLSSAYTIYNDKQLQKQYEEYKDTIDEWDEKIEKYTERYVKQFSAMETALSKLQSSTSSLTGLLGS